MNAYLKFNLTFFRIRNRNITVSVAANITVNFIWTGKIVESVYSVMAFTGTETVSETATESVTFIVTGAVGFKGEDIFKLNKMILLKFFPPMGKNINYAQY